MACPIIIAMECYSRPSACIYCLICYSFESRWHAYAKSGCRESPGMRVTFFRVAERKEPKKGRPHCLRPLRFATGQPAVLGFGGVSLELAPFHFAQTIASPDPPNPALLGASRGAKGAEHPHGPLLRSAQLAQRVALAPAKRGRAQQWPEWMSGYLDVWLPTPAGCACGGAVAG